MQLFIKTIITDLLKCFYEHLFSAILIAVLIMFVYMYASENGGFKPIANKWLNLFKTDKMFRFYFFMMVYLFILLNRTLLNRAFYGNPLSNVIGIFSLVSTKNKINSEPIENIILFIPFSIFLLSLYPNIMSKSDYIKKATRFGRLCIASICYSFVFSFLIEITQVVLDLGTFQLADLVHNTTGGLIGGIIYYFHTKKKHK